MSSVREVRQKLSTPSGPKGNSVGLGIDKPPNGIGGLVRDAQGQ